MAGRPSSRFPRLLAAVPLGASVVVHGVAAGALAVVLWRSAGTGRQAPPPPPPVPVVVVTPRPAAPTPPPARGDLAVRPSLAPTPTPAPSARPTPQPARTARPTPRPTPVATAEQKKFRTMRQIPYFAKMSDAELRKQPLPPGMTDWDQVIAMGKKLDGLDWLFLPPETGEATPQPGGTPSPLPSPVETTLPDGGRQLLFATPDARFEALWNDGAPEVRVRFWAQDAPADAAPAGAFAVPYADDRQALLEAIQAAYVEQLFASPAP